MACTVPEISRGKLQQIVVKEMVSNVAMQYFQVLEANFWRIEVVV